VQLLVATRKNIYQRQRNSLPQIGKFSSIQPGFTRQNSVFQKAGPMQQRLYIKKATE